MCPYKVILLLVIKYNREYDIYINNYTLWISMNSIAMLRFIVSIFQFSEIDIIVSVIVFFLESRNYYMSKLKNKLRSICVN